MKIRDRIKELRRVRADSLRANPKNWRTHGEAQSAAVAGVLQEIGYADALIARECEDGSLMLVDGHLRRELTPEAEVPVLVLDITEAEADTLLATLDPLAAMAGRDEEKLAELLEGLDVEDEAVREMLDELGDTQGEATEGLTDPDDVPEQAEPRSKAGDVWVLGEHRLMCGDSTSGEHVATLLDDATVDVLLSDPPYCSGGFQEAGKKSGSVGTRGTELIANDQLSTRGYTALIKSVLSHSDAGVVYLFTDWRMWVNLYDVVESSGFGVRSMIVWDKGSPGMGRGWRNQHELVMCGSRVSQPFDPKSAQGNVISAKRTGNKLHATEKPCDLLLSILSVTDFAKTVYEPFSGSGTTLIACEQLGRRCYAMELEPKYVDVAVARWEEFTGKTAELAG